MPVGVACVLSSANACAGVPSAKIGFPLTHQHRIDQQQHLICQPMLEHHRSQLAAAREDQVRAVLRLDAANAIHEVWSNALARAQSPRLSRLWVTTYFVATLSRSAIGLCGAFGQKPDHASYVRRPSNRSNRSPYFSSSIANPVGVRYGTVQSL